MSLVGIFLGCNSSESSKEFNRDTSKFEESMDTLGLKEKTIEPVVILSLVLTNEKVVYSFKTKSGKTMNILLDNEEKYMVYRFGTENKVELQFPEKLENSFEQFTYSYYFRGGGAMNMGLDLNYLSFKGETHQFVIFDEWSAGDSEDEEGNQSVGIKIIDLSTQKEIIIEGVNSTVKGTLINFRDNGLVKIEEGEM